MVCERALMAAAVGLVVASGQAFHMTMDAKCADKSGKPLPTQDEQDNCNHCDGPAATSGPQEYRKCMVLNVVLAYNASENTHEGRYWGGNTDLGTENQKCAVVPTVNGAAVNGAANCPLHWNCDTHGLACRNGLYCSNSSSTGNNAGTKCLQCANCDTDPSSHYTDLSGHCGNCKTKFYPSVDEYSSFQIFDMCETWSSSSIPPCNQVYGCMEVDDKCKPGPTWQRADEVTTSSAATKDAHTMFVPDQEFFLEMGTLHEGHGIVRSPIVVYAQGEKEVTFFYAKLGMGGGYPRNIEWEQTGVISSRVECPDRVKHARSVFTKLGGIKGYCATISGESACSDTAKAWPSTECGFSTFKGFYSEGKFAGMEWPEHTDADAFPQSTHVTCNQDMCAHDVTAEDYSLEPVQFFVTWSGTDKDGRPLTSSGKSYQAFHLYGNDASDMFKDTKESAGKLTDKGSHCIQDASKC